MPWKEMSVMSQRREFVELAQAEVVNKRGLCRRFGISPTTGHKWFGRFRETERGRPGRPASTAPPLACTHPSAG